jgi:hypothetical protein
MKFIAFILIVVCSFVCFDLQTNSSDIECQNWKEKHLYFAQDVHYYNVTFAFVKIDTLDDLNINMKCPPQEYNIQILKIYANRNIFIRNDLDLRGVLNIFNRTHEADVIIQNVNGFNEKEFRKTDVMDTAVRSIQTQNVYFDFYRQEKLLTSENCIRDNFGSKTNFFGSIKALFFLYKVFYNNKICPYVFMNTQLEQLFLGDISNSLIFRNRIRFININETNDFEMNIEMLGFLVFNLYSETITSTNLNQFVFKGLRALLIKGNLEHFEEGLFENFKEIKFISIKSDELINFFHRGTEWLCSINRNLNVNLTDNHEVKQSIQKLVSVEIYAVSWSIFNKYYSFPDEDICLFENFPHSQLVLPLLIFDPIQFDADKYSCTLVWLFQYYKLYFYKNFTEHINYVILQNEYVVAFENITLRKCLKNEVYFNEKFLACNFSQRFENCEFTQFKTVPINGIQSFILMIKWFQYIIEVYIRTILCSIGLITNLITLKVIRHKMHKKNFSNSMYKHIYFNALFNVGFCLTYLPSLMNICIFPKTSFCSSIWRTEFAQYFYIYVILFLGNTFRLCCNISYIFFSISRVAISGTSTKSKLRKFIEKQNIKRFYIIIFILALGFSLFFVLENYVNKIYQDFDVSFTLNNAYDIKYCDSFRTELYFRKYILTPGFYVKCKLLEWLNLTNNILNNVLFFFISIFIDIFMVRYSSKVVEKKKKLHCPHLNEAVAYKTKLYKMIIINGTLFFFSHFPELLVTLIFYFYKSKDFIDFCYASFDCTSLIEMAQVFNFISIGFQFFIFLKFDQNVFSCILCLVKLYLKLK